MDSLLTVDNLQVQFNTKKGINTAVDGISFSVGKGEILGIVGESGCGKSVTSLSILRLLGTNARISQGSVKLEGRELLSLSEDDMCKIRGNEIAMIFQDPMTALNPTLTIGDQLIEPLVIHQGFNKKDARKEAVEVLKKVGISAPEKRLKEYPHQLSGGMRQRVMIAMAVSCAPKLLIADEPTTALDVTIQAQILELMLDLRQKMDTAVILITHDMGVVAETADNILVLYAGKVVEYGSVKEIFMEGRELLSLSEDDMCKIRGNEIAMIFQDPMTALNPTLTIGDQLIEPLVIHQGFNKKDARKEAVEVLKKVGISAPEKRLKEYPHQLSGGMRQRVMIAMAVSCAPKLLIADEPTTALDVTIQAQILELMLDLRQKMDTAVILITHDMGVVAETADNILVLYAGKVVEYGSVKEIFNTPKHPYTKGLLSSIPPLEEDVEELNTIEGTVPGPGQMPVGCRFSPRCPYADERCVKEQPGIYEAGGAKVSCFRYEGDNYEK